MQSRWKLAITVASVLASAMPLSAASAETRGYVVSWFAIASRAEDTASDCPVASKDPNRVEANAAAGLNTARRTDTALLDGKPVSPLSYPDLLVLDPNIETVAGKYAYGFDLGGPAANKFTDPDTNEKIDNQLWRAIGCINSYRATAPVMAYTESAPWGAMMDTSPAYAIRITGADLNKDGPVMVTLDRTIRHLERNALGGIRSGVTYVLDPSPRSHNVFSGEIKNGMLTIKPGDLYLVGNMPFYPQIDLKKAHMRIYSEADGKIVGYWGGYADWHAWAYTITARPAGGADSVGIYRALKKMADADPDPVTKENRMISATWRMEAVPAFFAAHADGSIVATASEDALGGVAKKSSTAKEKTEARAENR